MSFPIFPEPTSDSIFLIVSAIVIAPFLLYALGVVVYNEAKHRQGLPKKEMDKLPNPLNGLTIGIPVAVFSMLVTFGIVTPADKTAYENYKEAVTKTLSEDYGVELQGATSDFVRGEIVRAEYADGEKLAIALLDGKTESARVVQADDTPLPLLSASDKASDSDGASEDEASPEPSESSAPAPEPSPSLTAAPLPDRPLGSVLDSDDSSLRP